MDTKIGIVKILLIVLIVLVLIIVIVFIVKFPPIRLIRFRNLSYLHKLDDEYDMKKKVYSANNSKVVISLTTIPDRLEHMYPALSSILDQSVKVDEIYLNLPKVSRKGKEYILPEYMKKLKNIKINWLEKDFGPSTKLIPMLASQEKNTRIIVMDDDNLYHYNTVERLMKKFEEKNKYCPDQPKFAISTFGVILDCDGRLPAFADWDRIGLMFNRSKRVDHLQGCFGFVVTPSMFTDEVFSQDEAPPCVKSVDDVWFSTWLALNGIEIWTLDYSLWIVPLHDWGSVNRTPRLFDGENKGFVNEHKTLEWFEEQHGYRSLRKQK